MNIRQMIYDSAKYPLSRPKPFFILGFLILISSLLLSHYIDFNVYIEDNLGAIAFLLLILIFIAILFFFTILEAGYAFKIIEESIIGDKKPPEFNKIIPMLKHGVNEAIIVFIYFLVPGVIILTILDDAFYQINLGLPSLSDEAAIILLIAGFLLGFIADVLFTVAIPHMAFKGGALKEAFRFREIFKKIRQIGLKKLLIGYFMVILGVVAIGGPILEEIIESFSLPGFTIAQFLIAPYILMFSARFTALIYMDK